MKTRIIRITILSLILFSIITVGIAFLHTEIDAKQQADNLDNNPINHFNESQATESATNLSPYTRMLQPNEVENLSLTERVPEIVEREKFFETEEREKILEEINPSPTNKSTQLEEDADQKNISSMNKGSVITDPLEETSGILINNIDKDENNETESNAMTPFLSNETAETASITNLHEDKIVIHQNFSFDGIIPTYALFAKNEPAVSKGGNEIFYVGTFYAAHSSDGGRNWEYIDLLSQMPTSCCDQDLLFDSKNNIFVWSMMNLLHNSTSSNWGENNITIGVSVDANNWTLYDISPTTLNSSWTSNVFDYPQISMSNKYLYISANRFSQWNLTNGNSEFEGPVMMRIDQDLLTKGIASIPMEFMYATPPTEVFTPAKGANGTMYWATHISDEVRNSTMRVYMWNDDSSVIQWTERNIPFWNQSNSFHCRSPDGFNWCEGSDTRITTGWIIDDIIGFLWNVPAGGEFPYSYVNGATFDATDLQYLERPSLWSTNYDWMYANTYPDNDRLGIVAAYGGGNINTLYPSSAVGVGIPSSNGNVLWEMRSLVNGSNGPEEKVWGDYFGVRPSNMTDNDYRWIGTGFIMNGGTNSSFIKPYYTEFGIIN